MRKIHKLNTGTTQTANKQNTRNVASTKGPSTSASNAYDIQCERTEE